MSVARAVTVLALGAIVLLLVVLAIAGGIFGAGSQQHTCETIHWRGAQCEALRREAR
jgi:hypothetical protein